MFLTEQLVTSLAHSHQRRQSELGNRVLDEIIGQPGFGRAFLSEKLTGQSGYFPGVLHTLHSAKSHMFVCRTAITNLTIEVSLSLLSMQRKELPGLKTTPAGLERSISQGAQGKSPLCVVDAQERHARETHLDCEICC